MSSLVSHVDNLKCSGCDSATPHRVQQLSGVRNVTVDTDLVTVRVEHGGTTEHDQVADLLMHFGYPESGTGGTPEKAKSYISCAICRVKGEDHPGTPAQNIP
jgi:copper chaperone CopZ